MPTKRYLEIAKSYKDFKVSRAYS